MKWWWQHEVRCRNCRTLVNGEGVTAPDAVFCTKRCRDAWTGLTEIQARQER